MKKKGLIISTVVMVVVLIASLTTATYAWFTQQSSVAIDQINLSVKSNTVVNVGVKTGTDNTSDSYYYDTLAVQGGAGNGNTVSWDVSGATQGLGNVLTFGGLQLGGEMAVGTATANTVGDKTTYAVDGTGLTNVLSTSKTIIKAEGKGTTVTQDTVTVADANIDYLNATIGVEANKAGLKGLYVRVEVTTTGTNLTLGINASVHFIIKIGNKYADIEPFGATATASTQKTSINTPTEGLTNADGQAKSVFYFFVAQKDGTETNEEDKTFKLNGQEINDFQIFAYIDGADTHCVENAVGGCTIDISFDGTENVANLSEAEGGAAFTTVKLITLDKTVA